MIESGGNMLVILLLSDRYLKSRNCMFEVLEAIKDSRYKDIIIHIVLSDEDKILLSSSVEESIKADVYSTTGLTTYTSYWQNEENKLQAQIDLIGELTRAIVQIKEKRIVQRILSPP